MAKKKAITQKKVEIAPNLVNKVATFSIRPNDLEGLEALEKVKISCGVLGVSFSFVMVQLLKDYASKIEEE